MVGAVGIGGVFFRSENPEALAAWYREHLGVAAGGPWQTDAGIAVVAPFPRTTDYFPEDRGWMINFRVDDLEALTLALIAAGIEVETRAEWDSEIGHFARIHDPEGNPIELWQPAG